MSRKVKPGLARAQKALAGELSHTTGDVILLLASSVRSA